MGRGIVPEAAFLCPLRNPYNCRMTSFEVLQYFGFNISLTVSLQLATKLLHLIYHQYSPFDAVLP